MHDPLLSLYGMKIVTSPYIPKVQRGTREARSKGHPLVYWLSRQLARLGIRLEPDIVWQVPNMVGQVITQGNTIYCSPEDYDRITREFTATRR